MFFIPFPKNCSYLQWTSDKDLISMAQTLGVMDMIDIKFAENRINGQSRGWVASDLEKSLKFVFDLSKLCMTLCVWSHVLFLLLYNTDTQKWW